MRRLGRGWVYDARGELDRLPQLIVHRGNLSVLNEAWPLSVSTLPAVDLAADGVLVSLMDEGILMLNRTDRPVTKKVPKQVSVLPAYHDLPREVRLEPHELKWLSAKSAQDR